MGFGPLSYHWQFSLQHLQPDFFQSAGTPSENTLGGLHDSKGGSRQDCFSPGKQRIWHTQCAPAGLLPCGKAVYRKARILLPSPQGYLGGDQAHQKQYPELPCDEKLFFRVVKTVFNQRRKMIRNSIKTILLNLDSDFELLSLRPEQLDVSGFIELTRWVESHEG